MATVRTVRMESKPSEKLDTFVKRAIAVAQAAKQPIVAIFGTKEFIVCETHDAQLMHSISDVRN